MTHSRGIGKQYEDMAVDHLIEHGYQILARNYQVRQGEIDIIAKESRYLVFIEVKYRKNAKTGDPAEAVSYRKQQAISNTALYFLNQKRYPIDTPVRFDVITILDQTLTHIKNAFFFVGK